MVADGVNEYAGCDFSFVNNKSHVFQNSCSRISSPISFGPTRAIRLLYRYNDDAGSLLNIKLHVSPGRISPGVESYKETNAPEMEMFIIEPLYLAL